MADEQHLARIRRAFTANEKHIARINKGVDAWNTWRRESPEIRPDLRRADMRRANLHRADLRRAILLGADLSGANLSQADLLGANLRGANLRQADLRLANLSMANLSGSNLSRADLSKAALFRADLSESDLRQANLSQASLRRAHLLGSNLFGADLFGADLFGAILRYTVFGDVNLAETKGLDQCEHWGPSVADHQTFQKSGSLPLPFLRGIGLSDILIDYLPSLVNVAIQFYSCFISYSTKDHEFAERLYADLQNKGVRCWFAPHDMPIGAKILDAIDEAIRLRDKVLLILSEGSVASDWVEGEVTRALDEERTRKQVVLFPVRIDAAVMGTVEPWARLLRGQRNIGDFTRWKDHDAYQKAFERLLRDLKKNDATGAPSP